MNLGVLENLIAEGGILSQSSGLSSVVPFVPFGCSSRSTLYFHKNFFGKKAVYYFNSIARFPSIPQITSQHKKYSSLKISSYIFSAVRSSSSHGLFLRSVGLMHPQYRFIPLQSFVRLTLHFIPLKALSFPHCIPAVLCLPPSVFSAVAPSHSHRGWLRSLSPAFSIFRNAVL